MRPDLSAKAGMVVTKAITVDNYMYLDMNCISAFTARQRKVMAKLLYYGQVNCPFLALSAWWLIAVFSPT